MARNFEDEVHDRYERLSFARFLQEHRERERRIQRAAIKGAIIGALTGIAVGAAAVIVTPWL